MAIRPYPAEMEEQVVLRDGRRVFVRPMRPEDAGREMRFVDGLSSRSRYQRFMHVLNHLSPAMLERFTHPDYDRDLAMVALNADEFVAVGRYAPTQDPTTAEFALTVADAWQGKGLGQALLERLCRAAAAAGYERMVGHIFNVNRDMRELAAHLGFVEIAREDAEVTAVRQLR